MMSLKVAAQATRELQDTLPSKCGIPSLQPWIVDPKRVHVTKA